MLAQPFFCDSNVYYAVIVPGADGTRLYAVAPRELFQDFPPQRDMG